MLWFNKELGEFSRGTNLFCKILADSVLNFILARGFENNTRKNVFEEILTEFLEKSSEEVHKCKKKEFDFFHSSRTFF